MLDKKRIEILKSELGCVFDFSIIEKLNSWSKIFIEYNSHTNLMSKNDVSMLFEKHVFDSLAILKWGEFLKYDKILDVGCGGGFPSVILAICFPKKKIIANDSRIKKINFIKEAKERLELDNLDILYSRIEEAPLQHVDLVVSRAVGKTLDIFELSKKHLKKNGAFLIYKSKSAQEEIDEFKKKIKNAKFEIYPYKLPLNEEFERCVVVISSVF